MKAFRGYLESIFGVQGVSSLLQREFEGAIKPLQKKANNAYLSGNC